MPFSRELTRTERRFIAAPAAIIASAIDILGREVTWDDERMHGVAYLESFTKAVARKLGIDDPSLDHEVPDVETLTLVPVDGGTEVSQQFTRTIGRWQAVCTALNLSGTSRRVVANAGEHISRQLAELDAVVQEILAEGDHGPVTEGVLPWSCSASIAIPCDQPVLVSAMRELDDGLTLHWRSECEIFQDNEDGAHYEYRLEPVGPHQTLLHVTVTVPDLERQRQSEDPVERVWGQRRLRTLQGRVDTDLREALDNYSVQLQEIAGVSPTERLSL